MFSEIFCLKGLLMSSAVKNRRNHEKSDSDKKDNYPYNMLRYLWMILMKNLPSHINNVSRDTGA